MKELAYVWVVKDKVSGKVGLYADSISAYEVAREILEQNVKDSFSGEMLESELEIQLRGLESSYNRLKNMDSACFLDFGYDSVEAYECPVYQKEEY